VDLSDGTNQVAVQTDVHAGTVVHQRTQNLVSEHEKQEKEEVYGTNTKE
jgi:hypothetical protein